MRNHEPILIGPPRPRRMIASLVVLVAVGFGLGIVPVTDVSIGAVVLVIGVGLWV